MKRLAFLSTVGAVLLVTATTAWSTPVCTDGYKGGPPLTECGGRIFPESTYAKAYIQYLPDPTGFREYQDGLEYLAMKYPRWIQTFTLSSRYGKDAVTAGPDQKRAGTQGDTGDGHDILVVRISDNNVPDSKKRKLFFSLSVHGNERGGLEGGVRAAEDLAMAATSGGQIADGVDNYTSTTGKKPAFHSYEVRDVLAKEAVYLTDFNIDGWAVGDVWATPPLPFERGNSIGTDLNRQMPTIGRIDPERNPGEENETRYGLKLMRELAAADRDGRMAHGTDIHGEINSQAYVDIMYPAGPFDSVQHRRLMSLAERTKSVIDKTLFGGVTDAGEEGTGGNDQEAPGGGTVPIKPAHWATVWDTLGYTDTGFIGDYMATDLADTGLDYEFAFNHTVPDKVWTTYLQENFINGARAIIKTAMAYVQSQDDEFNPKNTRIDIKGRAGYVVNPDTVTDIDENAGGTKPGPDGKGLGANGQPVTQAHYDATNMRFFERESPLLSQPFVPVAAGDLVSDRRWLNSLDTLVLADVPAPLDAEGRPYDKAAYYAAIKSWVARGGNLILTDRALHALADMQVLPAEAIKDIKVYLPYANFSDLKHPMATGLRPNARQLVESAILGFGIGNDAAPMTVIDKTAWQKLGGDDGSAAAIVATTGDGAGSTDDGSQISIGQLKWGAGQIRVIGGELPMPTEENDHRFGLRDFGMTYTGLFVMENSLVHDAPGLGEIPVPVKAVPAPKGAPGRSSKLCVSGTRLRIGLGKAKGLTVRANGVRMRVTTKHGIKSTVVNLRRITGRRLTVTIVRRGAHQKKLVSVKRFTLCTAGKKKATHPKKKAKKH